MTKRIISVIVSMLTITFLVAQEKQFQLVTDASQLVDGDEIIIAGNGTAMSANSFNDDMKNQFIDPTDVEISGNILIPNDNTLRIILEESETEKDRWYLKTKNLNDYYPQGYITKNNAASPTFNFVFEWNKSEAKTVSISINDNLATIAFGFGDDFDIIKHASDNFFQLYTDKYDLVRIYRLQPVADKNSAPAPKLTSYDETNNIITLSVLQEDGTPIDNAKILYSLTTDDTKPLECNEVYNPSEGIHLDPGTHYLWAKTQIDGYDDSDIIFIESFTIDDNIETPTIAYMSMIYGQELTQNHWYIITADYDGAQYAMGTATNVDGSYAAIKRAQNEGTILAKLNEFDNNGIAEYTYNNGQLIEKNSGTPLQPTAQTSRAAQSTQFNIDTDNNHTLTVSGQSLGFNGQSFGFGPNYTNAIKLYTTGSDKNTGITDIVSDKQADEQPLYYNLQGIQITTPTQGLYIKRQGNKITKVLIQ